MKKTTSKIKSPLLKILIREVNRIGEKKTLYFLTIFLPLILFTLLALIYVKSVVRELPVVIYDADNSEISRMLIRGVDATSSMYIYKYVNSVPELKEEFLKGNAQGAFYFPRGVESDLKAGKKTTVVLFKNTTNLIVGNLLYKDGVTLIKTVSAGVLLKKLKSRGMTENKAMTLINPIRLDTNALYNPNYNYLTYIIPGLVLALLQMIIMIAGVLVISSEFSDKAFNELVELSKSHVLTILIGKSIPHLAIHSATVTGLLGIVFPLFGIEVSGSLIHVMLFILLFIFSVFFSCDAHIEFFS